MSYPFTSGEFDFVDSSKLCEVLTHLFLEESMRDVTDIDNTYILLLLLQLKIHNMVM